MQISERIHVHDCAAPRSDSENTRGPEIIIVKLVIVSWGGAEIRAHDEEMGAIGLRMTME